MAEAENLFAESLEDAKIKKFNERSRLDKFNIDKTLYKEIQKFTIFADAGRKAFEPASAEDLKGLIESMERTQAYRDRLTTINIQASLAIDELNTLLKSGEAYLFTEYPHLMKKCGNKETRDAAVTFVYGPLCRALAQWKSLKSIVDIAHTNLNNTYFALREIGENGRNIIENRKVRRSFDAV